MNILKVQISILNQGSINAGLHEFVKHLKDNERRFELYFQDLRETNQRPIEQNINSIQDKFLKTTNNYLLLMDDDVVPMKNPLDLVVLDKDIIVCPIPTWKENDICWLVLKKHSDGYKQFPVEERDGLKEADAVGNGCVLIARRVLEKVKPMSVRKFDKDGFQELGHDFNFCEMAKKKGFKIWAHWDYFCDQLNEAGMIKTLDLLEKYL